MSKLDPRPKAQPAQLNWEDLNRTLKISFNKPGEQWSVIDHRLYSMPKEEIIVESKKQGYKVTEQGEHHLRFE